MPRIVWRGDHWPSLFPPAPPPIWIFRGWAFGCFGTRNANTRLDPQWRVIYCIERAEATVYVERVRPHDYR
jgi:hypothetical protein